MVREAKLALILGVTLVIVVAVVFFRKDIVHATTPADAIAPGKTEAPPADPQAPSELRPRS